MHLVGQLFYEDYNEDESKYFNVVPSMMRSQKLPNFCHLSVTVYQGFNHKSKHLGKIFGHFSAL